MKAHNNPTERIEMIQLSETSAGAALETAAPEKPETEVRTTENLIEAVAGKAKNRLNSRRGRGVKPEAKAPSKANKPQTTAPNVRTSQLIAASDVLGLTVKKWADDRMALVKLPDFQAFVATLPPKDEQDCSDEIRLFRSVLRGVKQLNPAADRPCTLVISAGNRGYVGIHTYL